MFEVVLLLAAFGILAYNIPTTGQAAFRDVGIPQNQFDKNKYIGAEVKTRDQQKRMYPVVPRAQNNAYNDAVLKVINRDEHNIVFAPEFRQLYTDMLKKNRLRPNYQLEGARHWQTQANHMQGTYGDGFIGRASTTSVLDKTLPYEYTSSYVPARFAGYFSPYRK